MLQVVIERHECVQGSGEFVAFILKKGNNRFFSTEDIDYLLNSPKLFEREPESTLILTWDRNSQELPELGPEMDVQIYSELYIRHSREGVILEHLQGGKRLPIHSFTSTEWTKVIETLKQHKMQAEGMRHSNS